MFELEVQSADAEAVDVDDLPEQPPPEPAPDDDNGDDAESYDDDTMSTLIDDGDDEEDVTDPPPAGGKQHSLNTSFSALNGTSKEALGADDPPDD